MYQRDALTHLRAWKDKTDRKPLVLRGARQVGKTTLINTFGKEFDNYLYLNLEREEEAELFEPKQDMEKLITSIYLFCNKPKKEGTTLLFIDEIQNSAKAVSLLRYFYEKEPWLHVIAAGSMLENLEKQKISFPVGRVEYMALRPFSFLEFLSALGENLLAEAIRTLSVPEAIHPKILSLFNTYTLIGGMPEVIKSYVKNKDIVSLNDIYDTLLTGYRDDVEKYAPNDTMTNVIRYIIQYGMPFAAQEIKLGDFAGSTYKAREVGEAFRILEKSMLAELVYPSTTTAIPAPPEMRRSPKLLWLDTGLVNYASGLQKEIFGATDILDVYKGKIAEQIVGQEIATTDKHYTYKRHFWTRDKKGSDAEMDFVYPLDSLMIPVEVKAGSNAHLKSLHIYMDSCPHKIAVRVWSQPFSVNEVVTSLGKSFSLLNIPFYYVGQLRELISAQFS
ncbi:MAG: AAA family ATPase [Parabacteroides sp.]|nr:AAA family ATPase [Parabacteroides sp.]